MKSVVVVLVFRFNICDPLSVYVYTCAIYVYNILNIYIYKMDSSTPLRLFTAYIQQKITSVLHK